MSAEDNSFEVCRERRGMFDKSTWIRLPRNVVVGHGVLSETTAAIAELHLAGRPLVVTSPTPRETAAERVVADFAATGTDPAMVVVEEASFAAVERVVETRSVLMWLGREHEIRRVVPPAARGEFVARALGEIDEEVLIPVRERAHRHVGVVGILEDEIVVCEPPVG